MNASSSGEESKHSARLLGRERGTWVLRNWHNSRKLLTGAEAGQEHQRLEEEEGRSRRRHVVNRSVRLASGFTDPAKQKDETTSVWYGSVGWTPHKKQVSPGDFVRTTFLLSRTLNKTTRALSPTMRRQINSSYRNYGEEKEETRPPLNRVDSVE